MNPTEQKRHTTALDDLAAAMEDFAEATEERIVNFEKEIHTEAAADRVRELRHFDEQQKHTAALREAITSEEVMVREQYLDLITRTNELKTVMDEILAISAHLTTDLAAFRNRGWRARLLWLIVGR